MEKMGSTTMWGVAILLAVGICSTISGWWLWRNSDAIDPESRVYKVYRANYYASAWLFSPNRRFEEISGKYLKHWAKRMIVLGGSLVALSIVLGMWILWQ